MRAGLLDPDGTERQERVRRLGVMCAEVCDATCHVLGEQNWQDEEQIRVRLEWCRSVCLECAGAFDGQAGAESAAAACRTCADACSSFLESLD